MMSVFPNEEELEESGGKVEEWAGTNRNINRKEQHENRSQQSSQSKT